MIRDIYLLVGGEATRLRPLSEGIPKALLTIKGRLLIDLILENLEESNLDNINLICSIKHESYWLNYKKNSTNESFRKNSVNCFIPNSYVSINNSIILL